MEAGSEALFLHRLLIVIVCGLLVPKTFAAIMLSLTISYFELVKHRPGAFKGLLHQNESWDILFAILRHFESREYK
jgi:hypothetical protein